MRSIEVLKHLDTIKSECLSSILSIMEVHTDRIIHFEEENAYWVNLDDREDAIKSVSCLLIYKKALFFMLNDDDLKLSDLSISELNSLSIDNFQEKVNAVYGNCMYNAMDYTDAVEAADMVHMVEHYYHEKL